MSRVKMIAVVGMTAFLMPSPAFAYLDPAVGSMLLQGIIGTIAVIGTAWYSLREKVSTFVGNVKANFAGKRDSGE